jgi:hypothetical protein
LDGSLIPHFLLPVSLSVVCGGVDFADRRNLFEFTVAGLFMVAAMLGVAVWPGFIALAYLAHAAWLLNS